MTIGDRVRAIREEKHLTQGDIESRSGLFRCYISRVENGYTVPSVQTLEKFARALEIPMYSLFYEGKRSPNLSNLPRRVIAKDIAWGSEGKDALVFNKLRLFLSRMGESDRRLLLHVGQKMESLRTSRRKVSRK